MVVALVAGSGGGGSINANRRGWPWSFPSCRGLPSGNDQVVQRCSSRVQNPVASTLLQGN